MSYLHLGRDRAVDEGGVNVILSVRFEMFGRNKTVEGRYMLFLPLLKLCTCSIELRYYAHYKNNTLEMIDVN